MEITRFFEHYRKIISDSISPLQKYFPEHAADIEQIRNWLL